MGKCRPDRARIRREPAVMIEPRERHRFQLRGFAGCALGIAWLLPFATSCHQKPEIERALPAVARDVKVSRNEAPGSPEGDTTLTVQATFPDAPGCSAFIASYAPREGLSPSGASYVRERPGHESWSLACDGARMKYEHVLY